ncbi:hypothetical protein HDV03_002448 [Kappamyces sp. JEL0829]|nr:hypothetical protein HDV03_002448 [Kappamyces sp. JEL0829]
MASPLKDPKPKKMMAGANTNPSVGKLATAGLPAESAVPFPSDRLPDIVFDELLFEVLLESVFDADKREKKRRAICGACGKRCKAFVKDPRKDIFGRDLNATSRKNLF